MGDALLENGFLQGRSVCGKLSKASRMASSNPFEGKLSCIWSLNFRNARSCKLGMSRKSASMYDGLGDSCIGSDRSVVIVSEVKIAQYLLESCCLSIFKCRAAIASFLNVKVSTEWVQRWRREVHCGVAQKHN